MGLELITRCYNELVTSKYESVYSAKFVVLRDRKILERYLEVGEKIKWKNMKSI